MRDLPASSSTERIDEAAQEDLPPGHPATKKRRSPVWHVVQILIAVAVVVLCFVYAIPKFASYSEVWTEVKTMTPFEILLLLLATALNLVTYWWQNMASMPNLSLWKAAVNNQTSTSVANTMPGGAYIAVAVSYEMYRAWGFKGSDVGVSVAVTSVLNIYAKLLLPAVALALILLTGRANGALVGASGIGIVVLGTSLVLFGLILWKKTFAHRIGNAFGRAGMRVSGLFRRPKTFEWGDAAVRWRRHMIDLLVARWLALSSSTIVSHLTLYLVMLMALRFCGVSNDEVTWAQVLGVFAIGRLLSALPITPGGLGVVEVAYIGGIILAGRGHTTAPAEVFHAQAAAGVLVFRALTYGIQIPIGLITYLVWRTKKSWRASASVTLPAS
jgi:putative heme transporter